MRILVHADAARLFRWHLALIELLRADGHGLTVSFEDRSEPLPASLTALFDYDRARSGATNERFSTRLKAQDFKTYLPVSPGEPAEFSLDLATASFVSKRPGRTLRPLYDGSYKDYALFHALLDRRAPHLAVSDSSAPGAIWEIGLPAIEAPWRIATSFDQVTSRLAEGMQCIVKQAAAGGLHARDGAARPRMPPSPAILTSAGSFAAARASRKFGRARDRMSGDTPKWHVAWREVPPEPTPQPGLLNLADFRILADDGKRFYADPFLFVHEGERHVFVEELPDATGRGLISHFTISHDGTAGEPRPVLETSFHLSYPFVFAHGGQVWMLPESSAGGGLDLYRAERFPDTWVKEARLIEGRLHDATFFSHGGQFWIAAGSETLQSASWDALSLYSSPSLKGPWKPLPGNPVLVDARAARPAGALWKTADGDLIRPAQDCSQGYGGRLTLRRITELSTARFTEETIGTIAFGHPRNVLGPHTLSRGGGLEVIDLFARPGALKSR